jgi:hypothetical protein
LITTLLTWAEGFKVGVMSNELRRSGETSHPMCAWVCCRRLLAPAISLEVGP